MDDDLELYAYLALEKCKGHSYQSFADEIGIDSSTLTRIKNYNQFPSYQLAMKIEEKTKGKVLWWKLIQKCKEKIGQKQSLNVK